MTHLKQYDKYLHEFLVKHDLTHIKEFYGLIYKATNLVNGKIYIGQTKNKLADRISSHINTKIKSYFQKSISKYGYEAFQWEIITVASDNIELFYLEHSAIILYTSLAKNRKGYNIALPTSNVGNPLAGKTKKELSEISEKISMSLKTYFENESLEKKKTRTKKQQQTIAERTDEQNKKTRELQRNTVLNRDRIKEQERIQKMLETRKNLSVSDKEARKRKIQDTWDSKSIEEKNRKHLKNIKDKGIKVACITTKEYFLSGNNADAYYNTRVNSCCRGVFKHAGTHPETGEKLAWEYYDEEKHKGYTLRFKQIYPKIK